MMRTALLGGAFLSVWALAIAGCTMPAEQLARGDAYQIEDDGLLLRLPPMVARSGTAEDKDGEHAFAESTPLSLTPNTVGRWDAPSPGVRRWRLGIEREGARSMNLGFTRYRMPRGGRLALLDATGRVVTAFGDEHNKAHGELWTPIVPGVRAAIEVTLPASEEHNLDLALTSVGSAFRDFVEPRSGACNRDVVCAEGSGWRDEIRSVGVISLGGATMCTGTLVTDAAGDRKPFFLTARHCRVTAANAASLVVYWNYQASSCDGPRDGKLDQFQTGATFRAARDVSDFTLLELDDDPAFAHGVFWSGWDARPNLPRSAVAIHHPSTDEKRISFENDPLTVTSYLSEFSPGDGSHLRIADWDVGTTEPGSSGSGLWNEEHRLVGQLHGGYAACDNDRSDWYGWFARSWADGPNPATRLRDWLDPSGEAPLFADGITACEPPAIEFTTSAAAVGTPLIASAAATGGQPPYAFRWDIDGDGVTDCDGESCSYTFDREHDGDVGLTVTDARGCRARKHHRLVVDDPALCPRAVDARDLPRAIPDADMTGITSELQVTGAGTARKAKVSVRIEHPHRGDLIVTLVTPSGRKVPVHRSEGGDEDDLVINDRELAGLEGEPIEGTWKLQVVDFARAGVGSLVSWRLTLRSPCGGP